MIAIEFETRGLFALIKLLGYTAMSAEEHLDRVKSEELLRIAVSKMFELICAEEQIKDDGLCVASIEVRSKVKDIGDQNQGPWKQIIQDLWAEGRINRLDIKEIAGGKYAQYLKALFDFAEGD